MEYETGALETPEQIEKNPAGVVRRWLLELKLADKRESDYRQKGEKTIRRYRQKEVKRHSFNILWSNTETLKPAVYNSLPSPDVRRRFKDADPIGKAVAEVLSRSIEYQLDTTDFDHQIKECVLDLLLPGRAVARVRYIPSFTQVGVTEETHDEENEMHANGEESLEGNSEELEWEQTPIEHVQWEDFRISAGKEWGEVCWIAFRHRLTRDELTEQFGDEIGKAVQLDNTDDDDIKAEQDSSVQDAFKTAEVWEIWDKEEREVLFIAKGYKEGPLKTVEDPLRLTGFWPIPRPLYAVADSSSLVPVPLYEMYKEQADELDTITRRINIITKGLKLRGIYDSTIAELSELMRGEDNDLIAASNVTQLIERGGLDKAIWMMPIEQAANVLKVLYEQREIAKQTIYEITGISDILRGSTKSSETATAQQIKAQWGSLRVNNLKEEVSRFVRDLIRIQAEIIAEKFQPETLATMTGLKLPSMQDKQMMLQQGREVPVPAWEEVIKVLRDDRLRTFKVDIETDSTVAASVESDMTGLREVLQGLAQIIQGFGPAVQLGAMPIEALKEIMLTVTRRAKMGNAVEDAIDQMKAPPPPQAEQQQPDNSVEVEGVRQQGEAKRKQIELMHAEKMRQMEMQHEMALKDKDCQHQYNIELLRLQEDRETKLLLAQIEEQKAIEVAQINGQTTLDASQISAANTASENT